MNDLFIIQYLDENNIQRSYGPYCRDVIMSFRQTLRTDKIINVQRLLDKPVQISFDCEDLY